MMVINGNGRAGCLHHGPQQAVLVIGIGKHFVPERVPAIAEHGPQRHNGQRPQKQGGQGRQGKCGWQAFHHGKGVLEKCNDTGLARNC